MSLEPEYQGPPELAVTPIPPYTAVIFTSVRTEADHDEYDAMATEMGRLAAQQPGYLGVESARNPDRLGITVSYWETPHAANAWKHVNDHLAAQTLGRERWYANYRVRIATVELDYGLIDSDLNEVAVHQT